MNEPHLTFTALEILSRIDKIKLIKEIQRLGEVRGKEFLIKSQYEIRTFSKPNKLEYQNVYQTIEDYLNDNLPDLVNLEYLKSKEVSTQ